MLCDFEFFYIICSVALGFSDKLRLKTEPQLAFPSLWAGELDVWLQAILIPPETLPDQYREKHCLEDLSLWLCLCCSSPSPDPHPPPPNSINIY